MKRILSLLCISSILCCLFLSSSYAASTSDETAVPDAPAAVTLEDDQAEQPMEMTETETEEAGEALHVKATDIEENAPAGEEAAE